jgi:ATP-dependent protease Clp ATPase subunit
VGQEEAKKTLSVAVYNHYKRIRVNSGKYYKLKLRSPFDIKGRLVQKEFINFLGFIKICLTP